MGVPKALMPTGAGAWWKVQAARLDGMGLGATWVVSDQVRDAIAADSGPPARMVVASSSAPMFASVLLGLRSLLPEPPEGVFILPVDTPAPAAGVWRALAATRAVAAPHFEGRGGHPVYLPWTWVAAMLDGPAAQAPDPAALRLDELIAAEARAVPVSDAAVVRNLNTVDDLRSYLADLP
jgi:CTP:molybdopterin cytidylyltransferase MocA